MYHNESGDRFEGCFIDGKLRGNGTIHFRQGYACACEDRTRDLCILESTLHSANVPILIPCACSDKYEGQLEGFNRHGEGTCSYAGGGGTYIGFWKDDLRDGAGELDSRTGVSFVGDWKEDLPHGVGKRTAAEGLHEEGQFARGQLHGAGERRDGFGNWWRGVFVNGLMEGEGECMLEGGRYSGGFANDRFDGLGTLHAADGSVFKGGWKGGKHHGSGHLVLPNSGTEYTGEFADGSYSGRGLLRRSKQITDQLGADIKEYDGSFLFGLFHGEGRLLYFDSTSFEGFFARGQYHGHGVLKTVDGVEIDGEFDCGEACGLALMITPDGSRYDGLLHMGLRDGEGCLTSKVRSQHIHTALISLEASP